MRVFITGAGGFVGSNVARVFADRHHDEVCIPTRRPELDVQGRQTPGLDVTVAADVLAHVIAFQPDAVVHCAILNDGARMLADRQAAWQGYVGATRNVVAAANAVGAAVVLVSTDWVFDGTQGGADESTPPNPVNLYGVLKFASELVVSESAQRGAIARISAVQGVHWRWHHMPRTQDAGLGYLVPSIVASLSAGRPFTVWESDAINMVATPSLASDCAEMMWRIVAGGTTGVFHCCGGEGVTRRRLAELTAEVFELDPELLRVGPPDPACLAAGRAPYDTSLSAKTTATALGVELPGVRDQLRRLRRQMETGRLDSEPASRGARV